MVLPDLWPLEMPLLRIRWRFRAVIGIEQFGKSGIVSQVLEIGVVARLITVRRIQANGFVQTLMASGKCPVRQFNDAIPYQMKSSLGACFTRISKFSRAVT